jgi:hypothetical protein
MKSFASEVSIQASAERIWGILTDLSSWAQWNTTIARVAGEAVLGTRVTVYVKRSAGRAFPVSVVELDPAQRMVWAGGMPLGLFRGTRVFTLTPGDSGTTIFRMSEHYTGPLAALITRSIPDLQPDFEEFARCLKAQAESR